MVRSNLVSMLLYLRCFERKFLTVKYCQLRELFRIYFLNKRVYRCANGMMDELTSLSGLANS